MSVLTHLIYGGSNAVAGLTEGASMMPLPSTAQTRSIRLPHTAYFFPTIYLLPPA